MSQKGLIEPGLMPIIPRLTKTLKILIKIEVYIFIQNDLTKYKLTHVLKEIFTGKRCG